MPRRLLPLLNVVLAVSALGLALAVAREFVRPSPRAASPPRPVAPTPPPSPPAAVTGSPPAAAGGWGIIASRNLFSPSRSETPVTAAPGTAPTQPRPHLYGVVVRDQDSVAYLEDPLTRRVSAYRVGDTVAGATVESIAPDQVVLGRGEGQLRVRLHDPTKPRAPVPGAPAPTAAPAGAPVAPSVPAGTPPAPAPIPGAMPVPTGVPGTPSPFVPPVPMVSPGATAPPIPEASPGPRGPVPAGPLRRLPPGLPGLAPPSDAPRP
jgi:hypothetical protein